MDSLSPAAAESAALVALRRADDRAVATFMLVITPIWIEPLLNRFDRMKDRVLEGQILELALRARIPASRVYRGAEERRHPPNSRRRLCRPGSSSTKRISVLSGYRAWRSSSRGRFSSSWRTRWDTSCLHHTIAIIVPTLLMVGSLYLVHRLAGTLIARFGVEFGFDQLSDVASFPLLVWLGTLVSVIPLPQCSRSPAPEDGLTGLPLELTRDNHAGATTFVRAATGEPCHSRPGPIFTFWRASHPSLGERVDFANTYRP